SLTWSIFAATAGTIVAPAGTNLFAASTLSRTTGPFVAATARAELLATSACAWSSNARHIPGTGTTWQRAGPVAAADPFSTGRTIAQKAGRRAAGQRPSGNGASASQACRESAWPRRTAAAGQIQKVLQLTLVHASTGALADVRAICSNIAGVR